MQNPIPITEDWLKENGFRAVARRGDERTEPTVRLRRLAIAHHAKETTAFTSADDLCIDIAPNLVGDTHLGNWYVWLHQEEPYRFLHVRMMEYQHEVIALYEGLTGCKWEEKS